VTNHIGDLAASELNLVVGHPAQLQTRLDVQVLITALRECDSPDDYNEFQRLLFQHVWEAEMHRGKIRRVCKRLNRGESIPVDAPDLGNGCDVLDPESWRLEELTFERVVRQLRSVGDALAWRVTGFDRRFVLVLSRNESAGPMAGKKGLESELGVIEELWNDSGHFALLHDLTSCLRIGDVTEFFPNGYRLIREVKASAGRAEPKQTARMEAARDAINAGAPLPGCDQRLVQLDIDLETHLAQLGDAVSMAADRGSSLMKIPGGRALTAQNLFAMATSERFVDRAEWIPLLDRQRATVLRRAGIADAPHHLNMRTIDWAARSPVAVPFGVYPMEARLCADIICDFAIVEIIMSPDAILERSRKLGFDGDLLLPRRHGDLDRSQPMFRLRRGNRALVVHAAMSGALLAELIDLDVFLHGASELIDREDLPTSPIVTFRNEASVWR
jgi:hypothetical protein